MKLADGDVAKKIYVTIGANAFANNPNLVVDNYNQAAVQKDGISAGAFENTGMEELDLSETGIVDVPAAFANMAKLAKVTLNAGTKTIKPSTLSSMIGKPATVVNLKLALL